MVAEEAAVTEALSATDVTKSFGARIAVANACLSVAAGEFVVVLGPSGSGKTTLFRCLSRLENADSGSIMIEGTRIDSLSGRALAAQRRKIGIIFQQFNLVRRLSALDNVVAGRLADIPLWQVLLRQFPDADLRKAAEALVAVGLRDHLHQRASTLSGGQQQRVAIARALAQDSRILLADEPIASLDPETARAILSLMRNLARDNSMAVLCTLHQPALAQEFADRILTMKDGVLSA